MSIRQEVNVVSLFETQQHNDICKAERPFKTNKPLLDNIYHSIPLDKLKNLNRIRP